MQSAPSAPSAVVSPPRLAYLDGLRGLAAFVVMLGHCLLVTPGAPLPPYWLGDAGWREALLWPTTLGTQMVYLFIMVSGFSLAHSELARRARGKATPLAEFARRRAWRILPTYYAAMALAALAMAGVAAIGRHTGYDPAVAFYPLTPMGVLSHLVMLHTTFQPWMFQFALPLWSLAPEAQLYVLFPLLFWGLTRRPGALWPLGWAAVALLPGAFGWLPPVLGLRLLLDLFAWFALGMATAGVAHASSRLPRRLLLGAGILLLAEAVGFGALVWRDAPLVRVVWAAGYACLLLGLYHQPAGGLNLATWRPLRTLGAWSYSLYVVHFPLVAVWAALVYGLALDPWPRAAVMLVGGTALSLAGAWAMFMAVERFSLARVHGRRPESP